jgi:hypothetical protein
MSQACQAGLGYHVLRRGWGVSLGPGFDLGRALPEGDSSTGQGGPTGVCFEAMDGRILVSGVPPRWAEEFWVRIKGESPFPSDNYLSLVRGNLLVPIHTLIWGNCLNKGYVACLFS